MNIFEKQPSEIIPISMDFANLLDTGETITTLDVTITDSEDTDLTSTLLVGSAIVGSIAKVTVQSGTDGERYKITIQIVTSNSALYEEDVFMKVYEI